MNLKESLKEIKTFLLKRYKDNLAAILVFGSANTGEWKEGISDIDLIILLKKDKNLDFKKEADFLFRNLKKYKTSISYFYSINGIKKYLKERNSWSTYITILHRSGSKKIYASKEFQRLKEWLIKNLPTKKDLREYIKRKDKVEINGYFMDLKDYFLMKVLFSHLRRKIQIINYLQNKDIEFDFEKCLEKINLEDDKIKDLKNLKKYYLKRGALTKKEINRYYNLAKMLTDKILRELD